MGLFDGYVDPEQFNSGGGLLGRLLALQQSSGQFQPQPDLDQALSPMPSPASMLSPLLSGYDQAQAYGQPSASNQSAYAATWPMSGDQNGTNAVVKPGIGNAPTAQTPVNGRDFTAAGGLASPSSWASSAPTQNTLLAQYLSERPSGIYVPPNVFIPGTPENDDFVHWAIAKGRAIGNAVGSVLNSDSSDGNSTPITPRPDIPALAGGRAGEDVPGLTGPPNSAILGGPGRIFITDEKGNVVVDVTGERAKEITPGRKPSKRKPTPEELELLKKMGR